MSVTPEPLPSGPIPANIARLALSDLRLVIDRLSLFSRRLCTTNIDAQIEAIIAFEGSGISQIAGLSSASSSSILMACSHSQNAAALAAVAIRAIDTSADYAQYCGGASGQKWNQAVNRIASMTRPTLSDAWSEALAQTPLEIVSSVAARSIRMNTSFGMSSAVQSLERAVRHYSKAAATLRSCFDEPSKGNDPVFTADRQGVTTLSGGDVIRTIHAVTSGDRALGRALIHIASVLEADEDWMPLCMSEWTERELPKPKTWLSEVGLISIALRMPAVVAATVAFRLENQPMPKWVEELTAARQIAQDPRLTSAFQKSASCQTLKTVARPREPGSPTVLSEKVGEKEKVDQPLPAQAIGTSTPTSQEPNQAKTLGPAIGQTRFSTIHDGGIGRVAQNPLLMPTTAEVN